MLDLVDGEVRRVESWEWSEGKGEGNMGELEAGEGRSDQRAQNTL